MFNNFYMYVMYICMYIYIIILLHFNNFMSFFNQRY